MKKGWSKEQAQLAHDHSSKSQSQDPSPGSLLALSTVPLWYPKGLGHFWPPVTATLLNSWETGASATSTVFPLSLFLSPPSPLRGWSCLISTLKDLSRSAHEDGSSTEGGGLLGWCWPEDKAGKVCLVRWGGKRGWKGLLPRRRGSNGWRFWCRWMAGVWWGRCERDKPIQVVELKNGGLRT